MTQEETDLLCRQIAGRYLRLMWWHGVVTYEDMIQVGRLAVIRGTKTYERYARREVVPLSRYLHRAVVFAISRHAWRVTEPFSGLTHRPKSRFSSCVSSTLVEEIPIDAPAAPEALEAARWRWAVRRRVKFIAARQRVAPLADALLEDTDWKTLHRSGYGVNGTRTRVQLEKLQQAIRNDPKIQKLMRHYLHP